MTFHARSKSACIQPSTKNASISEANAKLKSLKNTIFNLRNKHKPAAPQEPEKNPLDEKFGHIRKLEELECNNLKAEE